MLTAMQLEREGQGQSVEPTATRPKLGKSTATRPKLGAAALAVRMNKQGRFKILG